MQDREAGDHGGRKRGDREERREERGPRSCGGQCDSLAYI